MDSSSILHASPAAESRPGAPAPPKEQETPAANEPATGDQQV